MDYNIKLVVRYLFQCLNLSIQGSSAEGLSLSRILRIELIKVSSYLNITLIAYAV
jgi:hypothetical protein